MKRISKTSKPKKQKQPDITPEQAVAACDTLIAFVSPMYKGAQRDADMFAIVSFREFLSQLTGFRSVVNEIISDDYVDMPSTTDKYENFIFDELELIGREREEVESDKERFLDYFEGLFAKGCVL